MKRFVVPALILFVVVAVCGGIVWFNFFRARMISQFFAHFPVQAVTVSDITVKSQTWTPGVEAVGTVSAAEGVDVATQVGGLVKSINFKANEKVASGALLVQIDDSVDRAGLAADMSTVAVSEDALSRAQALADRNVGTIADLQTAKNKLDQARGALDQLKATIALKAISAPFSGTIGIPRVDVGQYLQAGTVIATLQNLDAMKVDFTVPEQQLSLLSIGQKVFVGLDADHMSFSGKVTGIDPKIDPSSGLVSVEAYIQNPNEALRPGQFVHARVELPTEPDVIALPQTAVIVSLYGSYVYQVVSTAEPAAAGAKQAPASAAGSSPAPEPVLKAKQIFVKTGRTSGNLIEVLKGVTPGMEIVTAGQNKLSNGSVVAIDNSIDVTSSEPATEQ